jgi:hypothetical protein
MSPAKTAIQMSLMARLNAFFYFKESEVGKCESTVIPPNFEPNSGGSDKTRIFSTVLQFPLHDTYMLIRIPTRRRRRLPSWIQEISHTFRTTEPIFIKFEGNAREMSYLYPSL